MNEAIDKETQESLFRAGVVVTVDENPLRMGFAGTEIPDGWLVFNASRPIIGSEVGGERQEWQGDFLNGRYYSAVDREDPIFNAIIKKILGMDAKIVVRLSKGDARAMICYLQVLKMGVDLKNRIIEVVASKSDATLVKDVKRMVGAMTYGEFRSAQEGLDLGSG